MNTLIFMDSETNGLPAWGEPSESPSQPHIVQLAAIMVDVDTRKTMQTLDVIIRPDSWSIPQECIDVHGITNEMAMDVGISEPVAIDMLMDLCHGRPKVAYNAPFDKRIVRIGTKRYCSEGVQAAWNDSEFICAMQMARKTIGGKYPKLVAAYKHFFGKEMPGAHSAMGDVQGTMDLYFKMIDQDGDLLS